jgi:hypothetical protein
VRDFGILSEAQWLDLRAREHSGEALPCPGCRTRCTDPRCVHTYDREADGRKARYVACKRCGFWPVGKPSERAWTSVHRCERASVVGGPSFRCEHCDRDPSPGPDRVIRHDCGKYMLPEDVNYTCRTCGRVFGRESQTPWELEWVE